MYTIRLKEIRFHIMIINHNQKTDIPATIYEGTISDCVPIMPIIIMIEHTSCSGDVNGASTAHACWTAHVDLEVIP